MGAVWPLSILPLAPILSFFCIISLKPASMVNLRDSFPQLPPNFGPYLMDSGQKKIKSFGPESHLENLMIEMEIVMLSKKKKKPFFKRCFLSYTEPRFKCVFGGNNKGIMSKRMKILWEEGRSKEGVTEYIWHENRVGVIWEEEEDQQVQWGREIGTEYDTYV